MADLILADRQIPVRRELPRYDYVNPDAPKGGTLNSVGVGTFDSFNPYIVQGTPAAGFAAFGGGLIYDTLMEQSTDEPSVSHPLIADAYKYPEDFSSATYRIDPRAKWHDGKPITVDDVMWSFNVLKANSPLYNRYYADVTEAVAISDREVEFHFDQKGNRELPKIIGDLVVLPKHWWEGTDASGKKRDITQADAGAAARLGRLQGRELQARRRDRVDSRQGLLGSQTAA